MSTVWLEGCTVYTIACKMDGLGVVVGIEVFIINLNVKLSKLSTPSKFW